ncbi:MAG: prepilin-type N-terminal cleavage/methylation domain-containing protein [bacterium]
MINKIMATLKESRGVTLIEVSVVSAIIGVITAMGAPSFNNLASQYRLRSAVQDTVLQLRLERQRAIAKNDSNNYGFDGHNVDNIINNPSLSGSVILATPSSQTLNNYDYTDYVINGTHTVTFLSNGRSSDVGAIFLTNKNKTKYYAVEVRSNGRICAYTWDGKNWQR